MVGVASFDGATPTTVDGMSSPLLRLVRATGLGALGAFLYGLIRSARPRPTPPAQGAASWEPLGDEAPTPTRSGPVTFTDAGGSHVAATEATEDSAADEAADSTTGEATATPQSFVSHDLTETTGDDTDSGDAAPWVEPDAMGECPGSHPIKGNDQSKIFHVPGGMSYSRTKAERCYCDEASAEADGYRKAKR